MTIDVFKEEIMFLELLIVLSVTYAGVFIKEFFKIPLPWIIVSMVLMFILLLTKRLKLEKIEKLTEFLLGNMTILFLPAAVSIYNYIGLIQKEFLKILILLVITTVITMIVTAKVVNFIIVLQEKSKEE